MTQAHQEDRMQFVLVIYDGGERPLTDAEQQAVYADYAALNDMPNVTGCPPLGLPANATTVRVANGSAVTAGGPYDARSAVAGFLVVEAEDLDAAVAVAARVPQARLGGAVEVRPSVAYW
jgi:hypothetical protein